MVELCTKMVVEYFWHVHFSCVADDGRVVVSDMNGFSGNLFLSWSVISNWDMFALEILWW